MNDRARVPFALVGVLLLVGASVHAATVATRGPAASDRRVDAALERVAAGDSAALRAAVARAAREAAARPVHAPANTTVGRVLAGGDDSAFRRALRLRVYLAAREAFRTASYREGDVRARASLPPTPNASALRDAVDRVRLDPRADGTALGVRLRGVRVTAWRDGRVVARERRTPNLTVSTPVPAMHERTRRFERRLNAGAVEGPGLGRRLTARLYPVAWARGYAQYGGLPVENVLANRHVELSANGAVLRLQRSVYGRSDPAGRVGLRRATARAAVDEFAAASNATGVGRARALVPAPNAPVERRAGVARPVGSRGRATGPDRRVDVSVGVVADRTVVRLTTDRGESPTPSIHRVADAGNETVDSLVRRSYAVEAGLTSNVVRTGGGERPVPDAPGEEWSLVDESIERTARVAPDTAPRAPVGDDRRSLRRFGRRVELEYAATRTWRSGNETTHTRASWTESYLVGVAVTGGVTSPLYAPDRDVRPLYERGGALDGPNLGDVPDRAYERLVVAHGGPDAVARRAVDGSLPAGRVTVVGRRPAGLRPWLLADLERLHDRVRNATTTVRAGSIAVAAANPHARLADALEERRRALVDAPERYDGVADRARVEVRAAYVDGVLERLRARRDATDGLHGRLDDALGGVGSSTTRLRGTLAASRRVEPSPRRRIGDGPTGNVTLVPDGGPSYLTLSPVGSERLPAVDRGRTYRPLAARNTNLFTMPYGDVAEGVVGPLAAATGGESVPARTGAAALVAANETLDGTGSTDPALRARRDRLHREVAGAMTTVRRSVDLVLRRETSLSRGERRAVVSDALGRWNGTGRRAMAATNGSLARAVAAEATGRGGAGGTRRSRLERRLRVALVDVRESAGTTLDRSAVNGTERAVREAARSRLASHVRGRARGAAANATASAMRSARDRWYGESVTSVPAGLPVLPTPGSWYATVNVWTVEVRGSYARFVVRAPRGGPAAGDATRYVRENATVGLDVDGDEEAERLGRNRPVRFRTGTVVAVAVPPGGDGVGDVDGRAVEASAGWPAPGCVGTTDCGPARGE
jgi:hypothetical protein